MKTGLACKYPVATPTATTADTPSSRGNEVQVEAPVSPEETVPAAPINVDIASSDAIQVSTSDMPNFGAVDFDWGDLGFDLNEYLIPQSNSNAPVLPSPLLNGKGLLESES